MDTNVWRTHDLTAGHQQLAVHKGVAQVKDLALAVRRLVDLDDDDGNGRHKHLQPHATKARQLPIGALSSTENAGSITMRMGHIIS
jgi:hypothetical protein